VETRRVSRDFHSLAVPTIAEADRVFAALADGGEVKMPLDLLVATSLLACFTDQASASAGWSVSLPMDPFQHSRPSSGFYENTAQSPLFRHRPNRTVHGGGFEKFVRLTGRMGNQNRRRPIKKTKQTLPSHRKERSASSCPLIY
jgi:hypothetical protein